MTIDDTHANDVGSGTSSTGGHDDAVAAIDATADATADTTADTTADAAPGELPVIEPKAQTRTIVIGDLDGLTPIDRGRRDDGAGAPPSTAKATLRASGPMVFDDPGLGVVVPVGTARTAATKGDRSSRDGSSSPHDLAGSGSSGSEDTSADEPRLVIIGDADEVDPDAPIDPRIRKRRRDVKRAAGRKRLRWILIALGAIGLIVGTSLVLRASVFAVKSVVVTGAHYIDQPTLDGITVPLRGESLVDVKLDDVRRKFEALPWVRSVDVTRDWPSTIRIDILERRPVAFYGGDDQLWHVLDEDGRVIATLTGRPVDYLQVSGSTEPVPPGEPGPVELLPGARVANAIPEQLKGLIAVVRVDQGQVSLELNPTTAVTATTAPANGKGSGKGSTKAGNTAGPSVIVIGTTDDLKAKLLTVLAMQETCPPGSYQTLDVSVANRPVATPLAGCKIPGSKGP